MSDICKINVGETLYSLADTTARKYENILLSNLDNVANLTVTTDATKGIAPYNTSYGYTNLTVDTTKIALTEADLVNGVIIGIQLAAAVGSSNRNVRIRFGETGTYFPLFNTTSVLGGNSYLSASAYKQFIYSTGVQSTGAFHMITDSNSTYSPASLGFGYGTCETEEATTAKVATLASYSLITNGTVSVKFTYAVPAGATLNINSKGAKAIYYQGAAITAGIIKAGDIATFIYTGSQYLLLSVDSLISDLATLKNDLDSPVDLSSYSKGDVIPAATIAKLKQHATHIKILYDGRYYHVAQTKTEASGLDLLVFISLDASGDVDAVQTLVITKVPGATDYTLADIGSVDVASYTTGGLLEIKLDSSNKFRLKDTNSQKISLIENNSQTSDINITFPSVNGTLATTDDATVTSEKVINALGYTPYSSANPSGYISGITSSMVTTALGYTPYSAANPSGYISGITSGMISTALGYIPYDGATNPNNYLSGITSSQVISALGYTPYNSTNPSGYITGITGTNVTEALGYIPYNATNPNGYITGISSSDVTTALGYTPYNATNPNNYITANATNLTNYYTKTAVDGMVANRFQAKIVTALPTSGISTSTIYMIASATVTDSYDEYMYIEDAWVKIGETSIDMSDYAKVDDLHNVALTGAYSSLVGRPTIPTVTSDLTNDSGYITSSVSNLSNYTKTTDLAAVAISGSYNDLLSKPTIPTATSQLTNDSNFVTTSGLSSINISTFVNNVPYATLNDIQGLEDIDVEEIKKAIAAMEHIGTVTQVTAGTGLSGGGNTSVTLNHSNSVTALTTWPSGTSSPENGGTFNVRDVKYDTEGHITAYQDRTITLPYIAPYDDTTVRGLISTETTARQATDTRVTSLETYRAAQFSAFVFCIFGIEQYIDPTTLQPVTDRYYQRSDVDTGIFMDSEKIDIHLKAWLKYHYGLDTQDRLKNVTCYVYAMGDHGVYVNHMVTYWSQMTNSKISSYPELLQTGMFVDDGYGSVHRFSTTEVGALLSSSDDGYIQADPLGTGKGFVSGWNTLTGRVDDLEDAIGDINTALDNINGEVI